MPWNSLKVTTSQDRHQGSPTNIITYINMPSITGQSVLIIGGSTGIGFAVADLCLAEKMTVHIASSKPDKLAHATSRLKQIHPAGNVTTHVCKLGGADNEAVLTSTLATATNDNTAKLDHIILTAGDATVVPMSDVTQPILETITALRLVPAILLGKLAPNYLKPHWTSSLILTGGAVASKPHKGYTYPAFFAGGLHPFVRALALEIAPLRVNVVAPGATETELWGAEGSESRAGIKGMVEKGALLGKAGSAGEVAEAYLYLMRDTNATGMNLGTDGGVSCQ